MIEHIQILETIENLCITAKTKDSYETFFVPINDTSFIGTMEDNFIEAFDLRFDEKEKDDLLVKLTSHGEDYYTLVRNKVYNSQNKPVALSIYNSHIDKIAKDVQMLSASLKNAKKDFRSYKQVVIFEDNNNPNTEVSKIKIGQILSEIYFSARVILKNILRSLSNERDSLARTKLSDFKISIKPVALMPTPPPFQNRAHSFIINPDYSENLRFKITKLRDMLFKDYLEDTEENSDSFIKLFMNKPVSKKIILKKGCSKAFLLAFISRFKRSRIITNNDYLKITSECFLFASDPTYNWKENFRKTTRSKSIVELEFIEECRNIFL